MALACRNDSQSRRALCPSWWSAMKLRSSSRSMRSSPSESARPFAAMRAACRQWGATISARYALASEADSAGHGNILARLQPVPPVKTLAARDSAQQVLVALDRSAAVCEELHMWLSHTAYCASKGDVRRPPCSCRDRLGRENALEVGGRRMLYFH